ncbi:MAG TPA: phosphate ABC transporter substrate-binding protein [Ktedonobacteraceae bacterium]|nr:phosphate ABC transporter substrate-binding protein [Ktedonobacteraceae bacterium]
MRTLAGDQSVTEAAFEVTRASIIEGLQRSTLLITLLSLAILLVGCGIPGVGTGGNGDPSGHVHIVGSTALLPLVTQAADLFRQHYPGVKMDVAGGGSITGLKAVTNHQADIGDSDIYADPALYPDPNLTDHIVCVNTFALIVDPHIPLSSLTTQQIIAIFTRKGLNWNMFGGPDLPVVPIIRPATSGTRALFRKYVLGGIEESGHPLTTDSSTSVINTVAHTPGAIGYVTTVLVNHTVRMIGIDGVTPTLQHIKAGRYKFWGYEHMYTLENGSNATTTFLDFMLTAEVQQLAQQLGYLPVSAIAGTAAQAGA